MIGRAYIQNDTIQNMQLSFNQGFYEPDARMTNSLVSPGTAELQ